MKRQSSRAGAVTSTAEEASTAILKTEIARLTAENAKLRTTLAQRPSGHSPDQFAAAIQHSVDTLQGHFAAMVNPTSNFALKEFRLEANLVLDVSPLGQVTYRFPREGEILDEGRLSKLVLDVVPVAKQSLAGSFTKPEFDPGRSVEDVDGIGVSIKKLLQQHQLFSLQDLLTAGTRARSQVELAALLGVGRRQLGDWLVQAELLTLRDLSGGQSRLLAGLGVTGLSALAGQNAADLSAKFNAQLAKRPVKGVAPLDPARVERWIKAAQAYADYQPPAPKVPS